MDVVRPISSTVSLINSLVDIFRLSIALRHGKPGGEARVLDVKAPHRSRSLARVKWAMEREPCVQASLPAPPARNVLKLDSTRCSISGARARLGAARLQHCRQKTIAKSFAAVPLVICSYFRLASSFSRGAYLQRSISLADCDLLSPMQLDRVSSRLFNL